MTSGQKHADFWVAMGESFGERVCPPVPSEEASPQECCEAIRSVLGDEVRPETLDGLSATDIERLANGFGAYFESRPPTPSQIADAIAATLARWPRGSLGAES